MSQWGNGGIKNIPGGASNIWSSSVPNGTYGVTIPPFGSLGNAHTKPQISGTTIIKGDGYVRYEYADGRFHVVSSNGMVDSGWK